MSIQAVKGVEIGDGFEVAGGGERGPRPDPLGRRRRRLPPRSTLAGGIEGGMSTGELLVVRAAMKPLATLNRPTLETVDTATKEPAVSFKERTDVTAVPAMGVVAETMVALVLAAEAQRKFGGDSVAEFVRNADAFRATLPDGCRRWSERHIVLVGLMGAGKTTVGRVLAARLGRRLVDSDELIEARTGRTVRQIFETDGEAAYRPLETAALPTRSPTPSRRDRRRRRRRARERTAPRCERRRRSCGCGPTLRARRAGDPRRAPSVARRRPGGHTATDVAEREPLYREVADVVDRRRPTGRRERGRRRASSAAGRRARPPGAGAARRARVRRRRRPRRRRRLGVLPPSARRAAMVTQAGIPFAVDSRSRRAFEIGHGEQHKTLATIEALCRGFAAMGLTRDDVVIAVGGGMVTDVAGFAAAI